MGKLVDEHLKGFGVYFSIISIATILSLLIHIFPQVENIFIRIPEGLYLTIAILLGLGYALNRVAPQTFIPSFVWAIFFGMALQPVFSVFTREIHTLQVMVELLAAMVLFGGGVEIPFKNFKKNFAPIASISLAGTLLTVLLFSLSLEFISFLFGLKIPTITFLLVGAILASIDPTAIIPSLKALKFKKPFLKDFAISESATNDVVGTIITRFFLIATLSAGLNEGILDLFLPFFSRGTMDSLALEIIWGILVGVFGAWVLNKWTSTKEQHIEPALFFAVPIFCFAFGNLIGGSGFLAAFVSGLLFQSKNKHHGVLHFFDTFVDGFIKPIIFILLGALVPMETLLNTASIGIISALIFMFLIRPIVVFLTLAPWSFHKNKTFEWRELLFMSFIRETGAIPAVLILVTVSRNVAASEYIFAIGMWVILLTLIIEPPLTPTIARKLKVAN